MLEGLHVMFMPLFNVRAEHVLNRTPGCSRVCRGNKDRSRVTRTVSRFNHLKMKEWPYSERMGLVKHKSNLVLQEMSLHWAVPRSEWKTHESTTIDDTKCHSYFWPSEKSSSFQSVTPRIWPGDFLSRDVTAVHKYVYQCRIGYHYLFNHTHKLNSNLFLQFWNAL